MSKNSKGGASTQFVRKTPGATSGRKLKDSQTNKVHTSSREITSEPYMSSNYKNSVKTTTTDLLNNKLWCLWCPDEHLRCWIEKIKNLREKNFEGEATTSFWMKRIEYLNSKYVGLTLVLNILILQFFLLCSILEKYDLILRYGAQLNVLGASESSLFIWQKAIWQVECNSFQNKKRWMEYDFW